MDMSILMWVIPAVLGLIGLLLVVFGLRRIFSGHMVGGGARTVGGLLFLSIGAVFGLLALNILTYTRLSAETPMASVSFRKADGADPTAFIATVKKPDGATLGEYPIQGDRWRLDARMVIWKPWANVIGFDSHGRLERISGDWNNVAEVNARLGSAASLVAEPMGLDLMGIIKSADWLPAFDTYQGSSVYKPMTAGAEYAVTLPNRGGLIARPTNDIARQADQAWQMSTSEAPPTAPAALAPTTP